ncbi:hypothetical protein O181_079300 [Austropuccinia psidii MF-1]|uniref:Retrovirus-related Pol polyprotein from transposon TNT 1-94-like beta-barrel domain-containing protein n=1 Tax=Austropuccinia psidii MF-1 TaxID=1389203 RepID=A0A9Q3FL48_9BASI|nr:hypothetical protein [Austropuccinia psidii MF-1]
MDKPMVMIYTLSILEKANKQAETLQRFSKIAKDIHPKLSMDGSNFNSWTSDLLDTWIRYFDDDPSYFTSNEKDPIPLRNLISISFIRNSIDPTLFDSIRTRLPIATGRMIYQALKSRFSKTSWSAVVHQLNILIHAGDQSLNMTNHAITIQNVVNNIKHQIGSIDENNLITMLYFLSAPQFKDQITTALDTRKATNPELKIYGEDILDIIRQLTSDQSNQEEHQLSGIHAKDESHPKKTNNKQSNLKKKAKTPVSSTTTEEWKKQWLTSDNPCFYCMRVGHWAHECKLRAKAQEFKNNHKKSNNDASVAAIGSVPLLENSEAMPDSGATHSVVGDISLFTRLSPTNMILTVASRDKFHVGAIGDIILNTNKGPLLTKDVLYCKHIPGIVLSMGKFRSQGISISFKNNLFYFHQNGNTFSTFKCNFRWFIPVLSPQATSISKTLPNIKPLTSQTSSPINMPTHPDIPDKLHDQSILWQRQISHLSLRNLSRLSKFAAEGIPQQKLEIKSVCQSCAMAKSQHAAIRSPTRNIINAPGDVMCADLIGPISKSIDNKRYMLIVQDVFSQLVAAIPLQDKTEAK